MSKKSSGYAAPKAKDSFPSGLALGLKSFVVTGFAIVIIQLSRGSAQSEGPDKAIYILSILVAGIFLIAGLTKGSFARGKFFYGISAIALIGIGIIGVEQHDPINGVILSNRLWLGFGPFVLILTVLFATIIFKVLEWTSLSKIWKSIISVILFLNLVFVVPSFWQNSKTVIDADHSEYVINEILSPLNGKWPYSDFIPQYQTFYGFLFKPFSGSMNSEQVSNLIMIFLTILSFAAIIIGVFLAWLAIDKKSVILALGLVVPFTSLTQFPTREGYHGSIAALLSGLPIRVFPGLALLLALILILSKFKSRIDLKRYIALAILGVFAGLVAWQSQDFGIAAVITAFIVITLAGSTKLLDLNSLGTFALGFVPGFMIYPIVASISGYPINFNYFLFFARQFGSGFGAERIRTPGPVLLILPLIVLLVVIHGIYLYKSKTNSSPKQDYFVNSLIGFSLSLWSFAGFTYYLNRSYASGQMQILFLTLSISLAALVGIFLKSPEIVVAKGLIFSKENRKNKNFIWLLPFALIFSLPFATLILTPNPKIELTRIDEGSTTPRWPKATIIASVSDAKIAAKYAKENNLTIGFFGASAAYVEKETGVQSLSILNSPFDLGMSQQTVEVSCRYINKINPDVIVASVEGASLFQFEGKTLCNTYIQKDITGVRSGHFAVRVGK
jgi:hypothetical protein